LPIEWNIKNNVNHLSETFPIVDEIYKWIQHVNEKYGGIQKNGTCVAFSSASEYNYLIEHAGSSAPKE